MFTTFLNPYYHDKNTCINNKIYLFARNFHKWKLIVKAQKIPNYIK